MEALTQLFNRLRPWWLAITITVGLVALTAPQQIPTLIFKLCQIAVAVPVALLVDRHLISSHVSLTQAENGALDPKVAAARLKVRAWIFVGVAVAFALGA